MFACSSCGRVSPTVDDECPGKVSVHFEGTSHLMPCSAWPKNPREYAEAKMAEESMEAFFSGTVTLPDGTQIQVAVPVPGEVAKQIACLSVEYDLTYDKIRARNAERLKRQMDATAMEVTQLRAEEASELQKQLEQLQRQALQQSEAQRKAHIFGPQHPSGQAPYVRPVMPSPGLPSSPSHRAADWLDQYRKSQGKIR